jgi:hypothetical protein
VGPTPAVQGIQHGLERSPDHYLAGVLEVVGTPKCDDAKDHSSCVNGAKVVEVLAIRGAAFKPGDAVTFLGEARPGSRYLAFLVPVDGRSGVYGATWLASGATEDQRRLFLDELGRAGLKPSKPMA